MRIVAVLAALVTAAPVLSQAPLKLNRYPQLLTTRFEGENVPPKGMPGSLSPVPDSVSRDSQIRAAVGDVLSYARTRGGEDWLVGTKGAFRRVGDRITPLDLPRVYKPNQPVPHIDSVIRQVAADSKGDVWIASDHGVYVTDGDNWWHPLNRDDGMPYEDVTCLALAPNGDVWGGTPEGAWRLRNGEWRYFRGKRWMPGNRVTAITADQSGAVWLTTDKGVAKIEERATRLAEKAAHYEQVTQARHNRRGYVTGCGLKVPGDPNGGIIPDASDNDGLWTAIYIAAEAYRYGATKDPQARKFASESMQALLDLTRLSGYPGFPARAIIRKGENVSGYDPNETVRVAGETDKIWYASPKDPSILCKGDTSSDELDGHFFAYYIYHELVADAKEKEQIAQVCRAITNNLLDHNYTLVGHTGRRTLWGAFGPQFMNDDPRWFDERGLNSIEMLCYLRVSMHICGDKQFSDAYETLINKHHYLLNTLNYRRQLPWWAMNHSDDELAWCVYFPLIMLEREPSRRAVLMQSLMSSYRGLEAEHSPFYNFLTGAAAGQPLSTAEAVTMLQDWPWELINWEMKNSHRHDVTFRSAKGGRNQSEIDRVLPASERRVMKWNGNPWDPDEGGNGGSEEDGAAWLIGYWAGRYYKFIEE
jgi:hypothetical protein